jgi:hypothetical protein
MDLSSDTEEAIESYLTDADESVGTRYLALYGVLQAMCMQRDALEGLVRELTAAENTNRAGARGRANPSNSS